MSVRVNLLPEDVRARGDATRARAIAGVVALAFVGILGVLWLVERGQIADRQTELAAITAANAQLTADVAALQPFADLESRADEAVDDVVTATLGEGSVAAVLQDLSAVLPPNAEIESLVITLAPEAVVPAPGGGRLVYGQLAATGRVLNGLAPGVERLIIDVDRVAGFENAYVATSAVDEDGVASFTLEVELGPEFLTDRYLVVDETGVQG